MSTPQKRSLAAVECPVRSRSSAKRVLFASAHSIVDFSNGASVATLDVLHGLCTSGFECRAFCTPKLDLQMGTRLERVLDDATELYQVLPAACGTERARVLYTQRGHRVPCSGQPGRSGPRAGPRSCFAIRDLSRGSRGGQTYFQVFTNLKIGLTSRRSDPEDGHWTVWCGYRRTECDRYHYDVGRGTRCH
jgi:hypothetical protein